VRGAEVLLSESPFGQAKDVGAAAAALRVKPRSIASLGTHCEEGRYKTAGSSFLEHFGDTHQHAGPFTKMALFSAR
jgi:hypothetical protein